MGSYEIALSKYTHILISYELNTKLKMGMRYRSEVSESENGDLLIKNTERNQTIFIGASVRSMIGQSGQKIKLISRKVSSFERQDIDSNLIKKLVISFVGFMLISYSIQIFFQLLPVIYPAYQTIK